MSTCFDNFNDVCYLVELIIYNVVDPVRLIKVVWLIQ